MVSGGRVEVVIRKAPWAFQDPLASAVAWVPAVSQLASDVFEGLTADGMESLLGPSACDGTSCGLFGEMEGGGAGLAGWECFPFPVSRFPSPPGAFGRKQLEWFAQPRSAAHKEKLGRCTVSDFFTPC